METNGVLVNLPRMSYFALTNTQGTPAQYLPVHTLNFPPGTEDTAMLGGGMACVTSSLVPPIRSKGWRPGSGLKMGQQGRELHWMGLTIDEFISHPISVSDRPSYHALLILF